MDRNSIIGLVLILVILVGYNIMSSPSDEEKEAFRQQQDSLKLAQKNIEVKSFEDEEQKDTADVVLAGEEVEIDEENDTLRTEKESKRKAEFDVFYPATQGEKNYYTIENDNFIVTLSSEGGRPVNVELKNYETHDGKPVQMFDEEFSNLNILFNYKNAEFFQTDQFYFKPVTNEFRVSGDKQDAFIMRLHTADENKYIDFVYSLRGDAYTMNFDVQFHGFINEIDMNTLTLNWGARPLIAEKSVEYERRVATIFFKYFDEDRDWLSESGDDEKELDSKTHWVAFKQHFFSSILIAENGIDYRNSKLEVQLTEDSERYVKDYQTQLTLISEQDGNVPLKFYFGPNHFQSLKQHDIGLETIVNLGWGIFGWVNKFVVIPIFNFLESTNMGYGIIILILTIIIKTMLFPLTYKNYKSSAKMRVLKPEIDELNEKHKDGDPMKKQQAMMSLYKKTGVNPMAGCLPMVVQMPILYAMFVFFPSSIELRQESFLWAEDLSSYDSIMTLPFEIPFYGDHVSLFTLLMAASTMIYTKMNSGQMNTGAMPQMKMMMYIFPFMMLFFFNSYSSALSYYYLTANLISIGQMVVIKKFIIDEEKIRKQIEMHKKKPGGKKKSKFQKRLEDMAKKRGYQAPKK